MKRQDWETCSFVASGVVGSLAARDYKGVGSQYVDEGKCVVGFGWQEAIRFKAEKDLSGTLTKNQTQAVAFSSKDYGGDATIEQSPTLRSGSHSHSHANGGAPPAVAFSPLQGGRSMPVTPESPTDLNAVESQAFDPYNLSVTNLAATLGINAGMSTGRNGVVQPIPLDLCNVGRDPEKKDKQNRQGLGVATPYVVRRLTPTECERLQGFPDGHTLIPWRGKSAADCPDGPRYKALGNSMAVPVMRWIGQRIETVDNL